jgi:hypothetical protein
MKLAIQFNASIDRGMNDDAAWIWLVRVIADLKILSETGVIFDKSYCDAWIAAKPRAPSIPCTPAVKPDFASTRRSTHYAPHVLRETTWPSNQTFREYRMLVSRQTHRPNHLLIGKLQQLADCCSRPKYARSCGDMPSGIVVCRIYRISNARFDLKTHEVRVNEIATVHLVRAGVRK